MPEFKISEAFVEVKSKGVDKVNRDFDRSSVKLKRFSSDLSGLGENFNALGVRGSGAVGRLTGSVGILTTSMGALGVAAGAAGVAIAGALGVRAVSNAANLEQAMANVATISQQASADIGGLTEQINELSTVANVDAILLSEGLYQTISSGITDTADAMKFLEASAIAAKAGLTTTATAVDGLSSVVNAFGLEASEVTEVSDKFFQAVESGKLTFGELASSIGNVAPIASQLGVSLDDLLATTSALTTTGQSFSQAVTGVRQILVALLRPTKQATDEAAKLGIQFDTAALKSKGLVGFLQDLRRETRGNSDSMANLFGDVEGLNAALALTGESSDSMAEIQGKMEAAAGKTSAAFKIQNDVFNAQLDLLKNNLNKQLSDLGTTILPALTTALKATNTALANFDGGKVLDFIKRVSFQDVKLLIRLFNALRGDDVADLPTPVGIFSGPGNRAIPARQRTGVFAGPGERPVDFEAGRDFGGLAFDVPEPVRRGLFNRRARGLAGASVEPVSTSGIQAQAVAQEVEFTNERVREGIQLFEDWELTVDDATTSAQQRLERLIMILEEQGVQIVDNSVIVGQHTQAWRQATARIRALQADVNEELAETRRGFGQVEQSLTSGLQKIGRSFAAAGKGVKGTVDETIEGVKESSASFINLQNTLSDESRRTQAELLQINDKGVQSRLALLELETDQQIRALDRLELSVTQRQGAITAITETESLKRSAILQREFQRMGITPGQKITFEEALLPGDRGAAPLRQAQLEFQSDTDKFLNAFGQNLVDEGENVARSFKSINAAIEGGAQGGAAGALAGFVASILTETEGFNRILDQVGKTLGQLATAIDPLVSAVAEGLEPAFEALGTTLEALTPLFELFGQALKIASIPLSVLSKGIDAVGSKLGDFTSALAGTAGFLEGEQESVRQETADDLARLSEEFKRQREAGLIPANMPESVFIRQQRASLAAMEQRAQLAERGRQTRQERRDTTQRQRGEDSRALQAQNQELLTEIRADRAGSAVEALGKQIRDSTREAQDRRKADEDRGRAFQISQITGPTRDILVSLLKPLTTLDGNVFMDMLSELTAIRIALAGDNVVIPKLMVATPEGALGMPGMMEGAGELLQRGVPAIPELRGFQGVNEVGIDGVPMRVREPEQIMGERFAQRVERMKETENKETELGDAVTVMGDININVDTVSDISVEEINRKLQRELRIDRRRVGSRSRTSRLR